MCSLSSRLVWTYADLAPVEVPPSFETPSEAGPTVAGPLSRWEGRPFPVTCLSIPTSPESGAGPVRPRVKRCPPDLVIVANRLPVDRVTRPTASRTGARRPAAWSPRSSPSCGPTTASGSAGRAAPRPDLEPFEDDGMHARPDLACRPRRSRASTRGSPTPPSGRSTTTWWRSRSSTGSGGTPTSRSTGGSPTRPPTGPRRTPSSGCTTTSCSSSRRCCASSGPTCASASSCTSRSRRPSCSSSCRGAARSSRGCSAPTWSASSCPAAPQNFVRLVRQRVGHKTHRDLVYLPDGRTVRAAAFPISIDVDGFEELARSDPRSSARAEEIREALGNPRKMLPRRRPARLHQGHLRPAARVRRAARRRPPRRRGRRLRAGRDALARAGRAVPRPARRDRPARRPDQRRLRPDRQPGDLLPARVLPARGDGRALPGRRHHGRHALPRRHEPRRQGVRRLPLRRRRRAGPLGVRRARPTSCARPGWSTPTTSTA